MPLANDVYLTVSSLGDERIGETLNYTLDVDGAVSNVIIGTFCGKTNSPYKRKIATVIGECSIKLAAGSDPRLSISFVPVTE